MARFNRDTAVALFLLALSAGAYVKTWEIRTRDDGIMRADAWPQAIIATLAVLSVIYLIQSLRGRTEDGETSADTKRPAGGGIAAWLAHYANPLLCFALYFAFLLTLPWLGVLIGGTLLVFMILNVLGGISPSKLAMHALIAAVSVGGMWAIFTFALRVALPEGEILPLILPR